MSQKLNHILFVSSVSLSTLGLAYFIFISNFLKFWKEGLVGLGFNFGDLLIRNKIFGFGDWTCCFLEKIAAPVKYIALIYLTEIG